MFIITESIPYESDSKFIGVFASKIDAAKAVEAYVTDESNALEVRCDGVWVREGDKWSNDSSVIAIVEAKVGEAKWC